VVGAEGVIGAERSARAKSRRSVLALSVRGAGGLANV
jgi:hypothetical protein